MDFVFLIQEREFVRSNEQTYRVGKTSDSEQVRITGHGHRLIFMCNVTDCHKVWGRIVLIFDDMFQRRLEYGEGYYSGDLEDMSKEFLIAIINDVYRAETEILDVEEVDINPSESEGADTNETMLRRIGRKSVIRLKVPEDQTIQRKNDD